MARAEATTTTTTTKSKSSPRYFERGDEFWELVVEDAVTVRTRHGKIGTPGAPDARTFKANYEATREARRLVAANTAQGYVETVGSPPAPRSNAALEAAIVANPHDDAAYMVYADWLQSQGDRRGELIALQAAGKDDAARELLAAHADEFLGPLQHHQVCHDGYRGHMPPAFTWKRGFIAAARLAHNHHADREWIGRLATDVLLPLLRHPSGKFLVELTLNENDDPTESTLDDLFAIIATHPLPALRKLRIGDDVSQISWYRVGDLAPIWQSMPNLTHFEIEAGQFELGTIDLPNLTHAVFQTGGLSSASTRSIADASWPKLEHLEVYFGDPEYGCEATLDDALAILDRDLPNLRYLGLKNAMFQGDLIPHLASSRLVRQLKVLDMSCGVLIDEHVDVILQHRDAFQHLDILDVSSTYLSDTAKQRLAGVAKSVRDDEMWEDDGEYRFVRVGE
jgi:uncharacterized protein (TIGR02996 family)